MAELSDSSAAFGNVSYVAQRSGESVTVAATGANRTGGYHSFLQIDPAKTSPPQLDFINLAPPPGIIVTQMITPFHATVTLLIPPDVMQVTINDREGAHQVKIS